MTRPVSIHDLADRSEAEFERRLKADRDALAAKYDRRPNLYERRGEQPVLLSNGLRRSDVFLLIVGALCATVVGTIIGVLENGWWAL
jgi:hypothetical protein